MSKNVPATVLACAAVVVVDGPGVCSRGDVSGSRSLSTTIIYVVHKNQMRGGAAKTVSADTYCRDARCTQQRLTSTRHYPLSPVNSGGGNARGQRRPQSSPHISHLLLRCGPGLHRPVRGAPVRSHTCRTRLLSGQHFEDVSLAVGPFLSRALVWWSKHINM